MRAKRILIVEDNADLRRLFRTALSLEGYEVEEAGDGLEALQLIVVDGTLVSGLTCAAHFGSRPSRAIAKKMRGCPYWKTRSTADIDTAALEAACVLRKPVMPDELVGTVKRCLRSGAPAAGA